MYCNATAVLKIDSVYKQGKNFCNLPGVTKLIINEQDIFVETCKKVEYTPLKLHEDKGRA